MVRKVTIFAPQEIMRIWIRMWKWFSRGKKISMNRITNVLSVRIAPEANMKGTLALSNGDLKTAKSEFSKVDPKFSLRGGNVYGEDYEYKYKKGVYNGFWSVGIMREKNKCAKICVGVFLFGFLMIVRIFSSLCLTSV